MFEELELVDLGVPIKILPRNLAPISEMFLVFPSWRGTMKLLSSLEPSNEREAHLSGLICRSRSEHLVSTSERAHLWPCLLMLMIVRSSANPFILCSDESVYDFLVRDRHEVRWGVFRGRYFLADLRAKVQVVSDSSTDSELPSR